MWRCFLLGSAVRRGGGGLMLEGQGERLGGPAGWQKG